MSLGIVQVVKQNPNDQIGGGGCLCSETKVDCKGPYVLFPSTEMESSLSPHAVACRECLAAGLAALNGEASAPTTDELPPGGSTVSVGVDPNARAPGTGVRDDTYVPLHAEDAKLPRDGSPGAAEPEDVEPTSVEDPQEPETPAEVEETVEAEAVEEKGDGSTE